MAAPEIHVLSRESSRAEIISALLLANAEAMRVPHVIGTAKVPSRWDRVHAFIDGLLEFLDAQGLR